MPGGAYVSEQQCSPGGGVDMLRSARMLLHILGGVMGGEWCCSIGPFTYGAGSGVEAYVAMVENIVVACWDVIGSAGIVVFNNGTAGLVDESR